MPMSDKVQERSRRTHQIYHTSKKHLDINVEPPIKEEIVAAIKELKNGIVISRLDQSGVSMLSLFLRCLSFRVHPLAI